MPELTDAIAVTRHRYDELRAKLADSLSLFINNVADITEELTSFIDMNGKEPAPPLLAQRLSGAPEHALPGDLSFTELAASIGEHIQALCDTYEHLDDLTSRREKLIAGDDAQVVRLSEGQEFVFDGRTSERQALHRTTSQSALNFELNLSLTETVARVLGAAKIEPQPADSCKEQ